MGLGDYHPFCQPWNITDDKQEEEYLMTLRRLSEADSILSELEYGDGNVEIPEDCEWAIDFFGGGLYRIR